MKKCGVKLAAGAMMALGAVPAGIAVHSFATGRTVAATAIIALAASCLIIVAAVVWASRVLPQPELEKVSAISNKTVGVGQACDTA